MQIKYFKILHSIFTHTLVQPSSDWMPFLNFRLKGLLSSASSTWTILRMYPAKIYVRLTKCFLLILWAEPLVLQDTFLHACLFFWGHAWKAIQEWTWQTSSSPLGSSVAAVLLGHCFYLSVFSRDLGLAGLATQKKEHGDPDHLLPKHRGLKGR